MLQDYDIGYYSLEKKVEMNALKRGDSSDAAEESKEEEVEMCPVEHKMQIFMLMMSKDDNLLLQMGGFISALLDAKFLNDDLKAQVPELFL